ncbi:hypothetical protein DYY88_14075 [Leptolyngbya iicbica LK]|uniref:Gas vesicle protein GvpC n=1 Tax=Leptolyngbya iicbica LK TaxID=2294035 RepID=A0A4V2E2A8_9CYAN|nr:hypothetical protein [Leptolyngbya sp. LK]RZM77706.1 hypothetical protein DYY88_14075 [Leptolyngbya sp. LK]
MAALRDEWETARATRQEEVIQRRATVLEELAHCQQSREADAAQMRASLAEHYAAVQDETNLYLTQVEQQRRAMARQTAQQLKEFDAELRSAVADQRAANQEDLFELQQATQEKLAGHMHDRAVMRSRQAQALSEYVVELEDVVADYLAEIKENREATAVVDRAQRHRDREALTEDVEALREEFTVYRQQMRDFREDLRQSVWGDAVPQAAPAAPKPPKSAAKSRPAAARKSPTKAKPVATKPATMKSVAKSNGAKAPAPAAPKATPAKAAVPTEEAVFEYLQDHNDGARLTEIESTLGINRFQAVDALRSLIQKELIVQKDRTYRIQEEAVL